MLTTVTLDGAMGKQFGKRWELEINSPAEALRLIEANRPGLRAWVRQKLAKYSSYQVSCEYEDGKKELLDDGSYPLSRKLKSIRFTPVIEGRGNAAKIVVGALLIVASLVATAYGFPMVGKMLFSMGASLVMTGVIGALSPQPKKDTPGSTATSNYFDGPANTTAQGVPVQLIYGRVLAGSHAISAKMDIDDSATEKMAADALIKAAADAAAATKLAEDYAANFDQNQNQR